MKKGGYQIINLGGVELTTLTSMVGLSKKILASHLKPILLSGIMISGVKKNDVYVTAQESSGDIIISDVYGYNITIDESDDSIQVDEIVAPQSLKLYIHVIEGSFKFLTQTGEFTTPTGTAKFIIVNTSSVSITTNLLASAIVNGLIVKGVLIDSNDSGKYIYLDGTDLSLYFEKVSDGSVVSYPSNVSSGTITDTITELVNA